MGRKNDLFMHKRVSESSRRRDKYQGIFFENFEPRLINLFSINLHVLYSVADYKPIFSIRGSELSVDFFIGAFQ